MSSEEKKQILEMLETGKITPEEAINLMAALDENPVGGEIDEDLAEASQKSTFESSDALKDAEAKARSLWYIPLWIGVGFTVLGGMFIFWAMQASGFSFWFYCSWLPFLLGVFLIALTVGSRSSRWLFVHIKEAPEYAEKNISFGFPLPFGLGAGVLRNFGHFIPALDEAIVVELIKVLEESPTGEPQLVIDVREDDGEEVQIFIA